MLKEKGFTIGKAIVMKIPKDCLFVTTGVMTQVALQACEKLNQENIFTIISHDSPHIHKNDIKKFIKGLKNIK